MDDVDLGAKLRRAGRSRLNARPSPAKDRLARVIGASLCGAPREITRRCRRTPGLLVRGSGKITNVGFEEILLFLNSVPCETTAVETTLHLSRRRMT